MSKKYSNTTPAGKIEVFQDLHIESKSTSRENIRAALIEAVSSPWVHAADREKEFSNPFGTDGDFLAFEYTGGNMADAGLLLWQSGTGYEVSNIVPLESGQLSYTEYNNILNSFVKVVAHAGAQKVTFDIRLSEPFRDLETWVSPEAASKLRSFSTLANRSTGSAHPSDKKRWQSFIVTIHKEGHPIDAETLFRWLVEVEEWSEERANRLSIEYEQGLSLLDVYDELR